MERRRVTEEGEGEGEGGVGGKPAAGAGVAMGQVAGRTLCLLGVGLV